MLKKMLIAAMSVAVLGSVAASNASASWLHEHVALKAAEQPTETFQGAMESESELGRVRCNFVQLQLQLNTGTTAGTLKDVAVESPVVNCHAFGALAAICGTNSVEEVKLTKHATAQIVTKPANTDALTLQGIELFTKFSSCLELELTSQATHDLLVELQTPTNIGQAFITGNLETHGFGTVTFVGQFSPSILGTYGVKAV